MPYEQIKKIIWLYIINYRRVVVLPITKDDSKLFFQLINKHYEKSFTIITTNINFSQWDEVLGNDVTANAIFDRPLHHSHIITIKGNSYRLKDNAANQKMKVVSKVRVNHLVD